MIRRPPRSTLDRSSAASDVYKRQLTVSQHLDTNTVRLTRCSIENCHIGLVDGHCLFNNTAYRALHGVGLGVLPVSYTHLRAHETVLDLVCRLLLEKKTYNKPDPALYLIWHKIQLDCLDYSIL